MRSSNVLIAFALMAMSAQAAPAPLAGAGGKGPMLADVVAGNDAKVNVLSILPDILGGGASGSKKAGSGSPLDMVTGLLPIKREEAVAPTKSDKADVKDVTQAVQGNGNVLVNASILNNLKANILALITALGAEGDAQPSKRSPLALPGLGSAGSATSKVTGAPTSGTGDVALVKITALNDLKANVASLITSLTGGALPIKRAMLANVDILENLIANIASLPGKRDMLANVNALNDAKVNVASLFPGLKREPLGPLLANVDALNDAKVNVASILPGLKREPLAPELVNVDALNDAKINIASLLPGLKREPLAGGAPKLVNIDALNNLKAMVASIGNIGKRDEELVDLNLLNNAIVNLLSLFPGHQ